MKRFLMVSVLAIAAAAEPSAAGRFVGKEFPGFTAVDAITNEVVSLQALRGKAVVVDFWATWCGPCRRELPHLKRTYAEFRDQGLEVVGISLDSSEARFRTFVEQSGMNWPNVMEGGGWRTRLAAQYGVSSIPRVFVIDRNGICVADNARGRNLEAAVRQALAVEHDASAVDTDPATEERMGQLMLAQAAVQRTIPPLEAVSRRLTALEASLDFNPSPGSERVAKALAQRVTTMQDRLQHVQRTLHELGVVDRPTDPALEVEPPDPAAMRAAAGRMQAACASAQAQLAWVETGLVSLQRDVLAGSKKPETLDREISELHDHALQLAATWCGSG